MIYSRVSIIVPFRNEKRHIARCIASIAAQDYPKENLELLVVDGISDDGTRELLKGFIEKEYPVNDNPAKIVPVALNLG